MNYTYLVFDDETMKHHGVKGMHWGIRRYQNPDGSLTAAGKSRYGVSKALKLNEKEYIKERYNYQNAVQRELRYRKSIKELSAKTNNFSVASKRQKKQFAKLVKNGKEQFERIGQSEKKLKEIEERTWKTIAQAIQMNMSVDMIRKTKNVSPAMSEILGFLGGPTMYISNELLNLANNNDTVQSVNYNKYKVRKKSNNEKSNYTQVYDPKRKTLTHYIQV